MAVAVALLTAAAAGAFYIRENYTIHTVYVDGNVHYTEEEIKEIVMDGPLGDNSLYLSMKYKNRGIEGVPFVDVMDVKCGPVLVGSLLAQEGYFPAYHMSKSSWVSVILDDTVPDEDIYPLLELSYDSVAPKRKKT